MSNPYGAPTAPVADPEHGHVARPRVVTIALVILWAMLAIWAFGMVRQILRFGVNVGPMSGAYLGYVVAMAIIPAFLLVMIGGAKQWARVTLAALYGLVFLSRVYLLTTIPAAPTALLKSIFTPTVLQAIAFVLLCLPTSNAWFRAGRR